MPRNFKLLLWSVLILLSVGSLIALYASRESGPSTAKSSSGLARNAARVTQTKVLPSQPIAPSSRKAIGGYSAVFPAYLIPAHLDGSSLLYDNITNSLAGDWSLDIHTFATSSLSGSVEEAGMFVATSPQPCPASMVSPDLLRVTANGKLFFITNNQDIAGPLALGGDTYTFSGNSSCYAIGWSDVEQVPSSLYAADASPRELDQEGLLGQQNQAFQTHLQKVLKSMLKSFTIE